MSQCAHCISRLHIQMRVNAQTLASEQHLICDGCGKDIPLDSSQWFLWMKLLELRNMIVGLVGL